MKQFTSFKKEFKPLVKSFVNAKTGLNLAVNSKEVGVFYYIKLSASDRVKITNEFNNFINS